MDNQHLRYSVDGVTAVFCKGQMVAHNLFGKLEVITEEQYNKAMEVISAYPGLFQIMPSMIIPADKVMPDFDEKTLIGQKVGNTQYLWAWKDHLGNVWVEVTFQSVSQNQRKELVN